MLPCAASSVLVGSANPQTWMYSLQLYGPSSTVTRYRPRDGVVHLQAGTQPDRPWQGRAPWQTAHISGDRWPVGRGDRSEPTLWRGTLSLERPPAILVTPANLEGELRVILLARAEGALPIPHAIGHDGGAVLHVPEAHRVSKLVGKEFWKVARVHAVFVSPRSPDDPDFAWIVTHTRAATRSV